MKFASKLIFLLGLTLPLGVYASAQAQVSFDSGAEAQILTELNHARQQAGKSPLKLDPKLRDAARKHTELQLKNRALSHQFAGEPPLQERLRSAGVFFTAAAENVGMNTALDDVNNMFLRSPGHRANMLNDAYDSVGIGVIHSGPSYWITEDFAKEAPALSAKQAEDQAAAAFESKWNEHHPIPLKRVTVEGISSFACKIARSGGKLQSTVNYEDRQAREVVAFSTANPSLLAPEVRSVLDMTHLGAYAVGACTPEVSGSLGQFWIVMAFF